MTVTVRCPCGRRMALLESALGAVSTCPGCAERRAFTTADIVWASIDETSLPPAPAAHPAPPSPAEPPPLRVAAKPKTVRRAGPAVSRRSPKLLAGMAGAAVILVLVIARLATSPGRVPPPADPPPAAARPTTFAEARHAALLSRWKVLAEKVDGLARAPETVGSVLAELEAVERDGKGTEFEERARTSLRNVKTWAKESLPRGGTPATRVFPPAAEIVARAREALAQGRVGDALFLLEKQIDPRPDGPEKASLAAEREAALKKAEALYDGLLAQAREEAVDGRLDEARARLRGAANWGVSGIRDRAYADAAALVDVARAEREKRGAAARADAEAKRKVAISNYGAIRLTLEALRQGRDADAARAADRAETPESKEAARDLVAGWKALWSLVESSIAARAKTIKTLRFKDDTVAHPIKRVARGEVVFEVAGGEYLKKVRDLVEPEVLRQIPDGTPEGRTALALLALLADDVDAAEIRLKGAGGAGAAGVRAALAFATPYVEASADTMLAAADDAHDRKKCAEALLAYRRLSAAPSARLRALRSHARCSTELKGYTAAFEDVEKLVAAGVEPDDELLAIVATAFERCTATDRVLETLKALYRKAPGRLEVAQQLVLAFRRSHRYAEGLAFLKGAVDEDPANWIFRGEIRALEEVLLPDFAPARARTAGRYRIFSTAGAAAADEAAATLSTVYDEYARYFPPGRNEELPLYVRIFPSEAEMRAWIQRLQRIGVIHREEFEKARDILALLDTARSAGREAVGLVRAFFQKEPAAAATLDAALLAGLSRWADRRAGRVATPAQLEAFLHETQRLVEAAFYQDVAYLDALLVLLGGDDARRAAWAKSQAASLETSLKESAISTFGYLESHNEQKKTKVKADLGAVERALDAALASKDLLRLAEAKFFMTRLRLAIGDDEAMAYLLERLGAAAKTAASAKLRPGGGARPAPVYRDDPPPRLPAGVVHYGSYLPYLKELVVWRSDQLHETLRHEAFHQFLDTYVDEAPPWFNEGFATVFEVSRGGKSVLHPLRQREIQARLDQLPPLDYLMRMTHREFVGSPEVSALYAQSWSFIHWLISKGERWRLDRYFEALMDGRGPDEASRTAFGDPGLGSFEGGWRTAASTGRY